MNLETAKQILGDAITPEGNLSSVRYMEWSIGDDIITLDDKFTVEELEAIVLWIKSHD